MSGELRDFDKTRRSQLTSPCANFHRPFLIDLDSANGSLVNGEEVPASRYFELRTKDTITFGASTREYVLLNDDVA